MKKIIVIQARTNSRRLNCKVLLKISKLPQVVLSCKRAANTGLDIIAAIPKSKNDDKLFKKLNNFGINTYRGSLINPLKRIVESLKNYKADTIVIRLTADNIFPDGKLIEEIIESFVKNKCTYLTTNDPSSGLPIGVSVEVTKLRFLREANKHATTNYEKEHVTPYIINKYGKKIFDKYNKLNLGHYSCTIDTLEDYIKIKEIFKFVKSPVKISFISLIKQLEKNKKITNIKKVVIGGAQLGMKYGITNNTKIPRSKEIKRTLNKLYDKGIRSVDTAYSYNNSEKIIGQFEVDYKKNFKIYTKLKKFNQDKLKLNKTNLKKLVNESIDKSCKNLKKNFLETLQVHNVDDLKLIDGFMIKYLIKLKNKKIIQKIGASVQTPKELDFVLLNENIDHIQMPFNIIDHRWENSIKKIRKLKKKRSVTIHARSIFLQGLLLSKNKNLWKKAFINDNNIIESLKAIYKKLKLDNINELCIRYVLSQDWIDAIVVGMVKEKHIEANLKYIKKNTFTPKEIEFIKSNSPIVSDFTLNPSKWSRT